MKLLRIMVGLLGACLVTGAYGQSGSGGTQTGNNQAQTPATRTSDAQDQGKTPEPSGQNAQAATDAKSDLQSDEHHRRYHVRLGTIGVGAGYTRFSGPFFYNPFWYGFYPYSFGYSSFFYDPFFYSPFYAPGYLGGFSYSNGRGEVKLSGAPKTAEVYLNGAYAGTANKLKSMWLEPGAYDLSVSTVGSAPFHQRIYVLSGKSLKIAAKLPASETKPTTEEKQ
jgi:hypothetical protein